MNSMQKGRILLSACTMKTSVKRDPFPQHVEFSNVPHTTHINVEAHQLRNGKINVVNNASFY